MATRQFKSPLADEPHVPYLRPFITLADQNSAGPKNVTIHVDGKDNKYVVDKALLINQSSFFRSLFINSPGDSMIHVSGPDGTLSAEDTVGWLSVRYPFKHLNPETFEGIMKFLLTQELPSLAISPRTMHLCETAAEMGFYEINSKFQAQIQVQKQDKQKAEKLAIKEVDLKQRKTPKELLKARKKAERHSRLKSADARGRAQVSKPKQSKVIEGQPPKPIQEASNPQKSEEERKREDTKTDHKKRKNAKQILKARKKADKEKKEAKNAKLLKKQQKQLDRTLKAEKASKVQKKADKKKEQTLKMEASQEGSQSKQKADTLKGKGGKRSRKNKNKKQK